MNAVTTQPRRPPRRYRVANAWWTVPAVLYLVLFFVTPMLTNAWRSTGSPAAAGARGIWENYAVLVTDPFYFGVLRETILVAVIVTLVCILLGYPLAYFMVRKAGRWKGLILFCLIAPLLTSVVMRAFGWRVLFANRGLMNSVLIDWGLLERPVNLVNHPVSVYVALIQILLPFMVLSISSVLQAIPRNLEEAARMLGASKLRAFFHVTLPLSVEGIITGAILVFVLCNGNFVAALLLGGNSVKTLPLLIYQQFNLTQDTSFAGAMGNVLLVIALLGLWAQSKFARKQGG
ncbi:putative spermidine/putrescine transport system permease protein [Pseudochelatococcus lubricantis]|uniref:Spermidine/putrescine transport system permease protein n=1 Tax=Pseudochelatococcus lubricantis TaxID=1538102 RepID=A0ABX0UXA7_9HYPH|nr:ABC transporter permease [Pseudochelatococcus lubricantis]NIJ56230.1 putative spermidine/putrescine transport system permease protein [Pseudochelatococcus lubricantis]